MQNPALAILLRRLRLPAVLARCEELQRTAVAETWSHLQYLHALAEAECEERAGRRLQRLLQLSGLPEGKTLASLDMAALPAKTGPQVGHLLDGDFVRRAGNVLLFGLPGRGKTHLAAGIGREMILRHGFAVLFTPAFALVQRLLAARAALRLEDELARLDRFDVVILDDIGYVQHSRDEMEVLFTFLAERYERRSLMVTSNLVFSQWDRIFHDPMTTAAAVDRLVHHAEIIELNQPESYRTGGKQSGASGPETTGSRPPRRRGRARACATPPRMRLPQPRQQPHPQEDKAPEHTPQEAPKTRPESC